MIQKKLLLATAAGLITASAPLFAGLAGASATAAALKTTSQANIQAGNRDTTQPTAGQAGDTGTQSPAADATQNKPALDCSPLKSSFYAGLGIAMLNDKGFTGLMPKAMVGYGILYGQERKYYSALEIGGGAGTILLSTRNQHYRVSNFVNVSIIPGYMIYDDVMLYARLGAQATRYSKLNSTRNGGVYGIGLKYNYSQNWDTRVEYDYANNKNLNQFIADLIYKFS